MIVILCMNKYKRYRRRLQLNSPPGRERSGQPHLQKRWQAPSRGL